MIERQFMACERNDQNSVQYGPFATAEEAETQAAKLGFEWVLVIARTTDDFGAVTDVKTRFYQPGTTKAAGDMRCAPEPEPLSEEEARFFAQYERQMSGKPDPRLEELDAKFGKLQRTLRGMNGKSKASL